jgi:putative transposase
VAVTLDQNNGARLTKACALLNLSVRSYQRWSFDSAISADRRPLVTRPEPHNKLSVEEREAVLALCNQSEYQSCPPAFIVA